MAAPDPLALRAEILNEAQTSYDGCNVTHTKLLAAFPPIEGASPSVAKRAEAWALEHGLVFADFNPGRGEPYYGFERADLPLRLGDALDRS